MLEIDLKDKIIYIRDDEFTRAKVDSIKLIADKYAIKDILDFKLTFTENLFGVSQQSRPIAVNFLMWISRVPIMMRLVTCIVVVLLAVLTLTAR